MCRFLLEIREEEGTDTGRLEQTCIAGLLARQIDVRIERDARGTERLIHLTPPNLALIAAMQR